MSKNSNVQMRGSRKRRRDTGVRLTPRDVTILEFISNHYGCSSTLAEITDSSMFAIRNRMSQLARAGFVVGVCAPFTSEKLWLPTRSGLSALNNEGVVS